jgi:hypothetical protein
MLLHQPKQEYGETGNPVGADNVGGWATKVPQLRHLQGHGAGGEPVSVDGVLERRM